MRSSAFFVLACLAVLLGPTAAQVSQWAKPKWCKERDCPRFELINDAKGYQTRKYEPAIWVSGKPWDLAICLATPCLNFFSADGCSSQPLIPPYRLGSM